MNRKIVAALLLLAFCGAAAAQDRPDPPPWTEDAPPRVTSRPAEQPRVPLRWDRLYPLDELLGALRQIAAAFPDLVELRTIGRSVEGRELVLAVVTDRGTGPDTDKPAFWCDGNIHGNEAQAGDACLYLIWWLCENRELPRVAELLRERTFYVLPCLNPDGRAHWFDAPNTMHSSRGGKRPVDNDRDGSFDEDPPDDLDGDGELLQMRVRDASGGWRAHPEEPRLLVRTKPGERGEWRLIGIEGRDDDGDGRFNEDGPGGYDPNRDWPGDWRGPAEQWGAGPYPVSLPETRAVVDFLLAHPNVAGFQSMHNTGGMILRGPGSKSFGDYDERDDRVMRAIAERGEKQLPHYRSLVLWKDLYQVYGGEVTFAYEVLGIFSFTNELWTNERYHGRKRKGGAEGRRDRLQFDDDLELGARFVDWKPFDHPQLGPIELGGWRRETGRVPPPFMLQECLHRNMAFCLYHAAQMPKVRIADAAVSALPGGLHAVDVRIANDGMMPSRSARAAQRRFGRPDRVAVSGEGITVVTSGVVDGASGRIEEPLLRRPATVRLWHGVPGAGGLRVRFVVRGSGEVRVSCDTEKGGRATTVVTLP